MKSKSNIRKTIMGFMILILSLLCGCSMGSINTENSKNVRDEIEDFVQIPEDGVIKKEQFEAFAGTDRIVTFQGEKNGIKYSWQFSGRNIHNPKDMMLCIDFITDEASLAEIKEISGGAEYAIGINIPENEMITVPVLTLEIPEKWDADTAVFCFEHDKTAMKISDAVINTSTEGENEETVLSVEIIEAGKTFYIVAGNSKGQENTAEDLSQNNSSADNNSSDGSPSYEGSSDGISSGVNNSKTENQGNNSGNDNSAEAGAAKDNLTGDNSSLNTDNKTDKIESEQADEIKENNTEEEKKNEENKNEEKKTTVTISINCKNILQNMDNLASGKEEFVPANGVILGKTTVVCKEGDSVFDILLAVCKSYGIHMEHSYFPGYGSEYIEGINQLYEFDCGPQSGWKYSVNGWYPNYGCDQYKVSDGDVIQWNYVCE